MTQDTQLNSGKKSNPNLETLPTLVNDENDQFYLVSEPASDKKQRKEITFSHENLSKQKSNNQNKQTRDSAKAVQSITKQPNKEENEINDGNFISLNQQEDLKILEEKRKVNNFSFNSNFFERFIMIDFLKLLIRSSRFINLDKILQLKHIPYLAKEQSIDHYYEIFNDRLTKLIETSVQQKKEISQSKMLYVIFYTFKSAILSQVTATSIYNGLKIFYSSCIILLLNAVSNREEYQTIYMWAGIMCGVQLLCIFIGHNIQRFYLNFFPLFKVCFMRALYQKISTLSSYSIKQANVGKLVNLLSNDLNLLEFKSIHVVNLLVLPFVLIAIGVMLYTRLDAYSLIGFGYIILNIPLQTIQSKLSQTYYKKKAQLVDQRIKFTNEVIEGIRLIKMYAWEEAFVKFITAIRDAEIGKILLIQIIYISQLAFSSITHMLACFISFSCTYYLGDSSILTVPKMLSILDLFSFTKQQIVLQAIFGVSGLLELKVILDRMITVLTIESQQMKHISNNTEQRIADKSLPLGQIEMKNFSAYWKQDLPVIENISLNVQPGEFIGIVGRVGSGKSSLLNCILQEIPSYSGSFSFNGRVAYVEQEPYIFSSTVQENILFGSELDPEFYQQVLEACCLIDDIKLLDSGDKTQIGERGINLSGGQKARISLARAIYSQADIILLDDPLSAVDAKVAKLLVENAILKLIKGKTILLVTHQVHFTQKADKILIMKDGRIIEQGSYFELQQTLKEISNYLELDKSRNEESSNGNLENVDQDPTDDEQNIDEKFSEKQVEENNKQISNAQKQQQVQQISNKNDKLFTKESDENMDVTFNTYKSYLGYSSLRWFIPLMLAFFVSSEVVFIFYTRTISNYDSEDDNFKDALSWLGYFTAIYLVNSLLKYLLLTLVIYSSNKNIHNNMIYSLVRAKVLFFDTTPSGRILNKFSSDLGQIDSEISKNIQGSIEILSNFCILIVMIFTINSYFIIVVAVQLLLIRWFVIFATKALVQSKQIDLRHRSPIYTCFNQTVSGVLPIKIYMKENVFSRNFNILLENSLRTTMAAFINSRAYAFCMHVSAAFFSCIGIFMILAINNDPALLGQAIIFFLSISDNIQWGLRLMIQTDIGMSSALRVMNLIDVDQEPQLRKQNDSKFIVNIQNKGQQTKQGNDPVYTFPTNGEIEFKNIRMRYRKDLSYVLNGLSFKIQAGEKIGFIGRTGAGKSSIIQALYRMTEIETESCEGCQSFINIDGNNTQDLGIHTIRSGISIIPQVPFIFSGSIRRNIDPLNLYSDESILSILDDIHLKEKVLKLKKGLLTDMTNASEVFSSGEKQLICLGRAILRQSKLIVLDEATANCDLLTDQIIQQKVRERFINSTVITIAHRLNTIADYDRVIIMEKGTVVEQGIPYNLLLKDSSIFKEMVNHTGQKNFNQIFQLAKQSYFSKQQS